MSSDSPTEVERSHQSNSSFHTLEASLIQAEETPNLPPGVTVPS